MATQTQRIVLSEMDTAARNEYLASLVGQEICYIKTSDAEKSIKAFGPHAPLRWETRELRNLVVDILGRPALEVTSGMKLFGIDTMHIPIADLYDVLPSFSEADGPMTPQDKRMLFMAVTMQEVARELGNLASASDIDLASRLYSERALAKKLRDAAKSV